MKNIACMIGLHKVDEHRRYTEIRVRGKHIWRVNFSICRRCGKKLDLVTWRK